MFFEFLKLGISHILDINGVDHILFLIGLTILYTLKDWKTVLWLATAFTLGHSVTLALSAIEVIRVDSDLIEILIALSILIVAISNIFVLKLTIKKSNSLKYLLTCIFGLIHGIGFSNFFSSMLSGDSLTIPLLGFNLGVEIAQLLIVSVVLPISHLVTQFLSRRVFISVTSSVISLWAIFLIIERL